MFGPYAGFSTRFLKSGSLLDLGRSVKPYNLLPSLQAGAENFDLVRYLVGQVLQTPAMRLQSLRQFLPRARAEDWQLAVAGQRVQIIKQVQGKGCLQMGTEVVSSADGSLAALLGACRVTLSVTFLLPEATLPAAQLRVLVVPLVVTAWFDRLIAASPAVADTARGSEGATTVYQSTESPLTGSS